jgi:hypothetical protein
MSFELVNDRRFSEAVISGDELLQIVFSICTRTTIMTKFINSINENKNMKHNHRK